MAALMLATLGQGVGEGRVTFEVPCGQVEADARRAVAAAVAAAKA